MNQLILTKRINYLKGQLKATLINDFSLSQQEANAICSGESFKPLSGDTIKVENVIKRLQEVNKLESLLDLA